MDITPEHAQEFYERGRRITTNLATAMDDFRAYARVFEIRGGKLAIDAASAEDDADLGTNTELIIGLQNSLRTFFDADNGMWQAILDKYRTDY